MARIQKVETQTIHDLATLLELECSSIVCAKLARALGYQITGRPGRVELEKAGMCSAYYSVDVLAEALLREARRLVGRS
jgi:hypothetical protein